MVERLSRRALWMHKLSEEVVSGITRRVRSGVLAPGARLGTREEIAGDYVTSPTVVDRALDVLAGQRLAERMPDGSWSVPMVLPPDGTFQIAAATDLDDVVDILELRLGIETIGAALAAERGDKAGIEAITQMAARHERAAATGEAPGRADFRYHRAIAAASGNRYLLDLVEYLGPLLIPRMREGLTLPHGAESGGSLHQSIEEHRQITAAIAAGDPDAARQAMHAHLTRTIAFVQSLDVARGES